MHVPKIDHPHFRSRKGELSQNILAVCSFDLRFLYILSGWEGSAHDSRVMDDARKTNFTVPHNRYYLADAGFASSDAVLIPYRGVCYHLKEWHAGKFRSVNCVLYFFFI